MVGNGGMGQGMGAEWGRNDGWRRHGRHGGRRHGGGHVNVPAEKVGKFKVPCVCLEHGKAEPRAAIPYRIMPIEEFTTNAAVCEVCTLLGYGKVNQRVAQASAWNLNNSMSWDTLAAKRIEHLGARASPTSARTSCAAAWPCRARPRSWPNSTPPTIRAAWSPASNDRAATQDDASTADAQSVADDKSTPRRKHTLPLRTFTTRGTEPPRRTSSANGRMLNEQDRASLLHLAFRAWHLSSRASVSPWCKSPFTRADGNPPGITGSHDRPCGSTSTSVAGRRARRPAARRPSDCPSRA